MPLSEFLVGPYETALAHGQLLRVGPHPAPRARARASPTGSSSFHERPAATVACAVRVEERDGRRRAHRGRVGRAPEPCGRPPPPTASSGSRPTDTAALAEAAALAAEASGAVEDANGSVEYKQQLVRVLVERCFRDALG